MGFNRALGTIHLLASQTVGHIQRQLDAFSIHFELAGMQNVFLAQSLGIPFAEFVERRQTVSFRGFHFDHSISAGRDFRIRKVTTSLSVEVLNLLDKNYEIVQFFPMPGRSVRATLKIRY